MRAEEAEKKNVDDKTLFFLSLSLLVLVSFVTNYGLQFHCDPSDVRRDKSRPFHRETDHFRQP